MHDEGSGGSVTAGYSDRPLTAKLGVKPGMTVYVDGAPRDFTLDAPHTSRLPRRVDLVLLFCRDRNRLEQRLPVVLDRTVTDGMVWVAWPKRSSGVPTDLTENVVREVALGAGVVDVKVAAIDETWSGLKLVRRLRDR
jgi:hypothetical protein